MGFAQDQSMQPPCRSRDVIATHATLPVPEPTIHLMVTGNSLPETSLQESENQSAEKSTRVWQRLHPARLLGVQRGTILAKVGPWVHRGGFAVLDQGLISGSNFLVSILLARWLVPDQYGAYAVAFGIFVLLSVVYQALVLEPMAVFGGSCYRDGLRGYVLSLLWIHLTISLVMIAAIGSAALIAKEFSHSAVLAGALAGIMIASPCVLIFWLVRRAFYLGLAASKAALGAFVYSSLSMGGLYLLYHRGLLSPFTAFALMGLAALGTALYNFIRLWGQLADSTPAPRVRESWSKHWTYGRWALASSIANWIPAYVYYPLLSTFAGMAASGQLKAVMNFMLPIEQVKAALALLFLPYAARIQAQRGSSSVGKLSTRLTFVSVGIAGAYWATILIFRHPLFHFLYSGRYSEVAHLLPAVAFGSIIWSACFGPATALRAMESPASVFAAYALATFLSLLIGVPAAWAFGVTGAVWGSNLADVLSWVIVFIVLRRKITGRVGALERWIRWKTPRTALLPDELPAE
jgi:O-antigen/teichoic acid export membrane protein